ncbi:MAG: TIGR00269 family protein [Candidatus Woesearchaeota archaeon]|nr:TIGR00269 family protein [Candidatus Woesearchaeota archaeon]
MKNNEGKKFVRDFENKIKKTIKKFNLLNKKEKIFAAVSGGKDSTAILYLLKKLGHNVEAITVDVLIGKYTKQNLEKIRDFCKKINVKLHVVSFREKFGYSLCYIRSVLNSKGLDLKSCTICGVLRRYLINKYARKLKADKIVTGHNMDDEAQAILMNLLRNRPDLNARLGPISGILKDKKFIPRVKPLYLTAEKDIIKYSGIMKFDVDYGKCPCCHDAYRNFIRNLLNNYEEKNPKIKGNIVSYFLKNIKNLKNNKIDKAMNYCNKCGEPSKGTICQTCNLLSKIKQ